MKAENKKVVNKVDEMQAKNEKVVNKVVYAEN